MLTYSTSLSINANQETIWKTLSDVSRWHEWTPTVTRIEILDTPELKIKNRYKIYQPKLQPAIWSVTVLTPPSSFTWEASAPGMIMTADHTLKPISANQTELALKFSFQGLLGVLIGKLMSKTVNAYIFTEAQSLKKRVERS